MMKACGVAPPAEARLGSLATLAMAPLLPSKGLPQEAPVSVNFQDVVLICMQGLFIFLVKKVSTMQAPCVPNHIEAE